MSSSLCMTFFTVADNPFFAAMVIRRQWCEIFFFLLQDKLHISSNYLIPPRGITPRRCPRPSWHSSVNSERSKARRCNNPCSRMRKSAEVITVSHIPRSRTKRRKYLPWLKYSRDIRSGKMFSRHSKLGNGLRRELEHFTSNGSSKHHWGTHPQFRCIAHDGT